MIESPKPQPAQPTENERILQLLREQSAFLKKINDKLGFFVLILILYMILSFLGFILGV